MMSMDMRTTTIRATSSATIGVRVAASPSTVPRHGDYIHRRQQRAVLANNADTVLRIACMHCCTDAVEPFFFFLSLSKVKSSHTYTQIQLHSRSTGYFCNVGCTVVDSTKDSRHMHGAIIWFERSHGEKWRLNGFSAKTSNSSRSILSTSRSRVHNCQILKILIIGYKMYRLVVV